MMIFNSLTDGILPFNYKKASLKKNLSDVSTLYENLMKTDVYSVLTCCYLLR